MLEGKFNLKVAKSIKAQGIFCQKLADRFHPGVPDLYITSGIWMECKVLRVGGQNRTYNIYGTMTPNQREFMHSVIEVGDIGIYCARIEASEDNYIFIYPFWGIFKKQSWIRGELVHEAKTIERESRYDFSSIFNTRHHRNINQEWYVRLGGSIRW